MSGYKCWIHLRWFHRWPKTKSSLKKTMWYRCQTWLQTPDTGRTPQQTSGRPLSNRLYSLNKAQNASITTKPGPCPWPPSTNLYQWTLHNNNNNNCLWTPIFNNNSVQYMQHVLFWSATVSEWNATRASPGLGDKNKVTKIIIKKHILDCVT